MEAADREGLQRAVDHHDRIIAMRAASQLPGKGSTDVNVVPVPARYSKFQ